MVCAFGERTDPDVDVKEKQRVYKTTVDDCRHGRRCNNDLPFRNGEQTVVRTIDRPLLKNNSQMIGLHRRRRRDARTWPLWVSPTKWKTKVTVLTKRNGAGSNVEISVKRWCKEESHCTTTIETTSWMVVFGFGWSKIKFWHSIANFTFTLYLVPRLVKFTFN